MTSRHPGPEHVTQRATASDHARIIEAGGDVHVWEAGGGPTPHTLDALPPAPRLTGRTAQAEELLKALEPDETGRVATVVTGLPGVGKTALALHTAQRAVDLGHFPGGTLFVHLRGYAPTGAVGPGQALETLLRALGVRTEDLPPTVEEQAGLYQSELARRARDHGPALILADDASSPAQLLPLIPAHPGHRLLATSRDALTAPDFRPRLVPLDELDTDAAGKLIAGALAQVRPEDPRAGAEPDALEQVAAHCGGLPLALTIAAALLADDPGLPIATLADDLADTRTRLESLQHEDADGRTLAVRAAFDLSHRRLKERDARLFRLLTLNPGPDVSTDAATALSGRSTKETRGSLAALTRSCLLGEQPTGSGRWRAHDLIRLYAADLPPEEDEDEALERLLTYYSTVSAAADGHLRGPHGQQALDVFPDRASASTWLDAERANLIAVIPSAASDPATALGLVDRLTTYLHERRHFHEVLALSEYALAVARTLDDPTVEAWALTILGIALEGVRRFDEAVDVLAQVVDVYAELDERHSEGVALNGLGTALMQVRRFDEAVDALTRAVGIFRELDDRHGESRALNNLAIALQEVRLFDEAIDAHTRDLTICHELDDRHGESAALNNLGVALRLVGRFDEAAQAHTRDLALCRELDDRHGEGQALGNLGTVLQEGLALDLAIDAHTQAVAIYRELDDRHREGGTLNNLGVALRLAHRVAESIEAHAQAADIFRELDDRHREGGALNNLGIALVEVPRLDEAVTALTQALRIYREFGDSHNEAIALRNLDAARADRLPPPAKREKRRWFRRGRAGGPGA
ncbi:tetratricopeptide repeat protein [Streptomyces sp. NPDC056194]|uniref:tetratricopeptide repeat protein n=1 Tax=unclassified Streptomyces TaxID=2593676 RepID=UPI0035E0B28B